MAHNARIRASGFWIDASTVLPAEWEAFDQLLFESINGDLGGAWDPLAQIVLGGAGLRVTGPSRLDDATRIDVAGFFNLGASSVAEQAAGGTAIFYGGVQIKDAAASIDFLGGALLSVDTTAAPPVIEAELRMESGADVRLGANSEAKTTNARTNVVPIHMAIQHKYPSPGTAELYTDAVTDWGYGPAGATVADGLPVQTSLTTTTEWVVIALPSVPPSATITQLQLTVKASGSHTILPAQMPQIRLVRYAANGTRTVVGTQADTSVDATAFALQHTITLSGLTESASLRWYRLEVCGEYGVGAFSGFTLSGGTLTYTTSRVNHQHFETTLS